MRYSTGATNCKNTILVLQFVECKYSRLIPLLQPYPHQSRDCQVIVTVITGNIRFRDFALIKDGRDGRRHIHIYGIARSNAVSLFPVDFLCMVKGVFDIIILRICWDNPSEDVTVAFSALMPSRHSFHQCTCIYPLTEPCHPGGWISSSLG